MEATLSSSHLGFFIHENNVTLVCSSDSAKQKQTVLFSINSNKK